MVRQRSRDTDLELVLRKALHRRGLRYRVHQRLIPTSRRVVDIAVGPSRVAVEVRGCFWHACPEHGTAPKANAKWWADKLASNVARDTEGKRLLEEAGWQLIVVWEHELRAGADQAADRIAEVVRARRPQRRPKVAS